MAKSLNKSRMWISRLVFFLAILMILFTRQTFADETIPHELCDLMGVMLTSVCAIGRVYATAFLGGHKNTNLIDYGPFSVVRNPLYMFSLIGVAGIALMSNQIVLIVALPVIFYFLYTGLIKREEKHLLETFGPAYEAYCAAVPRLLPNFTKYKAPETVTMSPKLLWNAFRDATVWLIPYCVFELVEFLQAQGWLPMLY